MRYGDIHCQVVTGSMCGYRVVWQHSLQCCGIAAEEGGGGGRKIGTIVEYGTMCYNGANKMHVMQYHSLIACFD